MQDKLLRYYRCALARAVWVIAILAASVSLLLLYVDLPRLATAVLSTGVIGFVFYLVEKEIRTRLWKYAYPELDFSGDWNAVTTYRLATNDGHTSFCKEHKIRFRQDCLSIEVGPTDAKPFSGGWGSLVAGFRGKRRVQYVYEVNYTPSPEFPLEAIGVEHLDAVDWAPDGRPLRLSGKFAHCARGQQPLYNGTVTCSRVLTGRRAKWLHVVARLGKPGDEIGSDRDSPDLENVAIE